jgi:hypothetical protein
VTQSHTEGTQSHTEDGVRGCGVIAGLLMHRRAVLVGWYAEEKGAYAMGKHVMSWYRGKRLRARIALVAVPLLLLASDLGVREVALHSADHLTITVTQPSLGADQVVYQHTFGRSLAAEAEHLLNDKTTALWSWPLTMVFHQPSPGSYGTGSHATWRYQLTFTWHGMVVEGTERSTILSLNSTRSQPLVSPTCASVSAMASFPNWRGIAMARSRCLPPTHSGAPSAYPHLPRHPAPHSDTAHAHTTAPHYQLTPPLSSCRVAS